MMTNYFVKRARIVKRMHAARFALLSIARGLRQKKWRWRTKKSQAATSCLAFVWRGCCYGLKLFPFALGGRVAAARRRGGHGLARGGGP
ncbi:hypothetical protein, partial [Janthinobacterium sp. GW458P]|uniref:hypothetical protein n=1 Tax=Janthinobacterium sp. GW458P TaxID=1981504 RepID=UPI001C0BDFA3